MQPTGQPTSSPTIYYVAGEALSTEDPFAAIGTSTSFAAMVVAAAFFCCCIVMMCLWLYRRRKAAQPVDLENLSPYEKWMKIEEMKKAGENVTAMANESASNKWSTKFHTGGKDAERLDKLHSKHGVKLDRPGTVEREAAKRLSRIQNPMLGDLRASEGVNFDDVYGGDDEEGNFGQTWGDHGDQIPGADQLHSTHNPMFDEFSGEMRVSAMDHLYDIYAQDEDTNAGFEGTWDEEGNLNYDQYGTGTGEGGGEGEGAYDDNYDYGADDGGRKLAAGRGSLTGTLRLDAAGAGAGAGAGGGEGGAVAGNLRAGGGGVRTSMTNLQKSNALKRKSKRVSGRKSVLPSVQQPSEYDETGNL
jgi:hypothetical protein